MSVPPRLTSLKKIIIIGSGGAGKSTLAIRLGKMLNLSVHHLDKYFWQPGWVETERSVFKETQLSILKQPEWIIDGNFDGTLPLRLEYCDTVIMLDYNRIVCFSGFIKRYIKYKGKSRPTMTQGCDEKFDWSYLKWLWNYKKIKVDIIKKIEAVKESRDVYVFKNRRETEQFVLGIKKGSISEP